MYRVQGSGPKGRPVGLVKYVEYVEVGVKLRVFSKAIWSSSRFCRFYPWTKGHLLVGQECSPSFAQLTQCVGHYAVRIVLSAN